MLKPLRKCIMVVGLFGAGLFALGWVFSSQMLRRRAPDPGDPPSNYGLAYQDVALLTKDGIPLHGWWIPARAPNGRTLVICHGMNHSMDDKTGVAARLVAAGFNVLLFNFRAHGTSGGRLATFGALEPLDVIAALDWLQNAHGIRQVGLVGFSMGAGVALITAARDRRVRAVVADGAIHRLEDATIRYGMQRGVPALPSRGLTVLALWVGSLRAGIWLESASAIHWVDQITVPVLFVQGQRDKYALEGSTRQMAARVQGRAEVWVVPARHCEYDQDDPAAYFGRVVPFLEEAMLPNLGRADVV